MQRRDAAFGFGRQRSAEWIHRRGPASRPVESGVEPPRSMTAAANDERVPPAGIFS